eukprot:8563451-Pyramimonas_sp.AAC.1
MKAKLNHKGFGDGKLRMGCSGYGPGRFQISTDNDSWTLFALKTKDSPFVIVPSREELCRWKFRGTEINFIIDLATKNKPYI